MKKIPLIIFTLLAWVTLLLAAKDPKQQARLYRKNIQPGMRVSVFPNFQHAYQGEKSQMRIILSNSGTIGRAAWSEQSGSVTAPAETLGMEYPAGSGIEHMYGGGLWVGGKVDTSSIEGTNPRIKLVSTCYEGFGANKEMYAGSSEYDKLWIIREDIKPAGWDTAFPTIPFKKVSDEDFYCKYRDYNTGSFVTGHVPMGIEIIQKSYSWSSDYANNIIPIDLSIINKSKRRITEAYIGYFIDTDVGFYYQSNPQYYLQNYSGYVSNLRLAYTNNPTMKGATPIGCVMIHSPKLADALSYTYRWLDFTTNNVPSSNDQERYDNLMAWGRIDSNQSPSITALSDTRFILSFGPFDINPPDTVLGTEDTLNVTVAIISGDPPGLEHLKRTAARAVQLYNLGYKLPYSPPSPHLKTTVEWKRNIIHWDKYPETAWDDSNRIAEHDSIRHPSDSTGTHPKGGLVFEGYRLYRSNDPSTPPPLESFTLLAQYDIKDRFEFNTGLQYDYVDDSLVRGNTYWYAVTTISIPNEFIQIVAGDTTIVQSQPVESSLRDNAVKIILPFATATKKNQVLVVPNPYRVDNDYTYENGGWEGKTADWSENNRLIRFIYLPSECTLRIYTLAGDLVTTIEHNDPNRGDETWNLLSQSNRAIASGIYIFSVESKEFGTQVGKFVIIR